MTKEELLKVAKPILFNTEMVKAILEGKKTVTRRCVKYKYDNTEMKMHTDKYGTRLIEIQRDVEGETHGKNPDGSTWHKLLPYIEKIAPFKKGDILYVRETWCRGMIDSGEYPDGRSEWFISQCEGEDDLILKAHAIHEGIDIEDVIWKPSIHMPKEAARILLKVKDVRVERLQDITEEQTEAEGFQFTPPCLSKVSEDSYCDLDGPCTNKVKYCDMSAGELFGKVLWDSTIKKADIDIYGWDANPYVWVIEFERIEV